MPEEGEGPQTFPSQCGTRANACSFDDLSPCAPTSYEIFFIAMLEPDSLSEMIAMMFERCLINDHADVNLKLVHVDSSKQDSRLNIHILE